MVWQLSDSCDPEARAIADRHYNRQSIGATKFTPPGRCLVLKAITGPAFWVTSWPFKEYVRHAWGGAWVCSAFRNEGAGLSSELIVQAIAATKWKYGNPPDLGMITFVDPCKVRRKRDFGRCFRKAGFVDAKCPAHAKQEKDCAACESKTKSGKIALQLFPCDMPEAEPPMEVQLVLF